MPDHLRAERIEIRKLCEETAQTEDYGQEVG
jgi:hypothetical protein